MKVCVTRAVARCEDDFVDDRTVIGQLSAEEFEALRLRAVLQGSSVQSMVELAVRSELGQPASGAMRTSRGEFIAEMLARAGVDPASPEHLAELEKARQDVRFTGRDGRARGAA